MARRTAGPSERQRLALVFARSGGATLATAARAAGVHVSTACRWQAADAELRRALHEAADWGWRVRHYRAYQALTVALPAPYGEGRPHVDWRKDCPTCGAAVELRTTYGLRLIFWRCGRWPACRWASWRPRAPGSCPACDRPWYWAHSRRSIGCICGYRQQAAWG